MQIQVATTIIVHLEEIQTSTISEHTQSSQALFSNQWGYEF